MLLSQNVPGCSLQAPQGKVREVYPWHQPHSVKGIGCGDGICLCGFHHPVVIGAFIAYGNGGQPAYVPSVTRKSVASLAVINEGYLRRILCSGCSCNGDGVGHRSGGGDAAVTGYRNPRSIVGDINVVCIRTFGDCDICPSLQQVDVAVCAGKHIINGKGDIPVIYGWIKTYRVHLYRSRSNLHSRL